jgi:hypothetical protein
MQLMVFENLEFGCKNKFVLLLLLLLGRSVERKVQREIIMKGRKQ